MSDASPFRYDPIVGVSQKRPTILPPKTSDSGVFAFRSRWCHCAKFIMAVVVAFPLVAVCFHLPAARAPALDRLRPARPLAAAAAAAADAVAVVTEAADHEPPAFFLVGRALHPPVLHPPEARSADAIVVVHLPEVGFLRLLPWAPPCRTVSVDPDPVADFVEAHFAVDLAPHQGAALADDADPAAARAHPPKLTVVRLFLLPLVRLAHRVFVVARRVDPGLCRVLAARAIHLRAVPMAGLSRRHELVRLVYYLQRATPTRVRLPRAVPLLRAVAARRVFLLHAHSVPAIRLTRARLLPPGPHDQPCRAVQA